MKLIKSNTMKIHNFKTEKTEKRQLRTQLRPRPSQSTRAKLRGLQSREVWRGLEAAGVPGGGGGEERTPVKRKCPRARRAAEETSLELHRSGVSSRSNDSAFQH